MRAMAVGKPGPIESTPLIEIDAPIPEPGRGEILVRVRTCGVCRTDLHVAEGELAPRRPRVVPGHEIVGYVSETGKAVKDHHVGDRVGIGWQGRSCGKCVWCRKGEDQLCQEIADTGGINTNRWFVLKNNPELAQGNIFRFNLIGNVIGCGAYADVCPADAIVGG